MNIFLHKIQKLLRRYKDTTVGSPGTPNHVPRGSVIESEILGGWNYVKIVIRLHFKLFYD